MDNLIKQEQTFAWIFLAIALASGTEPTDINGISIVADGINHAVPTQKELQTSVSWLSKQGLIVKQAKTYLLTSEGKLEYENASQHTKILQKILQNLEIQFEMLKQVQHDTLNNGLPRTFNVEH
jgi:hypothetical protein